MSRWRASQPNFGALFMVCHSLQRTVWFTAGPRPYKSHCLIMTCWPVHCATIFIRPIVRDVCLFSVLLRKYSIVTKLRHNWVGPYFTVLNYGYMTCNTNILPTKTLLKEKAFESKGTHFDWMFKHNEYLWSVKVGTLDLSLLTRERMEFHNNSGGVFRTD